MLEVKTGADKGKGQCQSWGYGEQKGYGQSQGQGYGESKGQGQSEGQIKGKGQALNIVKRFRIKNSLF